MGRYVGGNEDTSGGALAWGVVGGGVGRGHRDAARDANGGPCPAFIDARHAQPDMEGFRPSDLARLEGFEDLATWLEARQAEMPMPSDK